MSRHERPHSCFHSASSFGSSPRESTSRERERDSSRSFAFLKQTLREREASDGGGLEFHSFLVDTALSCRMIRNVPSLFGVLPTRARVLWFSFPPSVSFFFPMCPCSETLSRLLIRLFFFVPGKPSVASFAPFRCTYRRSDVRRRYLRDACDVRRSVWDTLHVGALPELFFFSPRNLGWTFVVKKKDVSSFVRRARLLPFFLALFLLLLLLQAKGEVEIGIQDFSVGLDVDMKGIEVFF